MNYCFMLPGIFQCLQRKDFISSGGYLQHIHEWALLKCKLSLILFFVSFLLREVSESYDLVNIKIRDLVPLLTSNEPWSILNHIFTFVSSSQIF